MLREKIKWIWGVWDPIRLWFFGLMAFTFVSALVTMVYPMALRKVIDDLKFIVDSGQKDNAQSRVSSLVVILLIIGVTRFFVHYYPALRAYLNLRIEKYVRETYFAHVLAKGSRFFQRFRTGDLVTRLTDDITGYPKISWFCCSGIFRAVDSGSKLVVCIIAMLYLNWRLTLLAIAPLPLMVFFFVLIKNQLRTKVEAQRREISATNDQLEATFSGVRIIKAHNAEDEQTQALKTQLERRIDVEMDVVKLWQLVDGFYNSLGVFGQIIVVAVGGIMVVRGDLSSGSFYAFYLYLGTLIRPLLDLPNLFVTGKQAFVCIDREEEIRLTDQDEEGGVFRGQRRFGEFQSLRFEKVRYAYPKIKALSGGQTEAADTLEAGPTVLADIDFRLRRGQKVAIVGRLGSGKSTFLKLAAGRLSADSGVIQLNGSQLIDFERRSVLDKIGYVSQDARLFSESVRDNVIFGRARDDEHLAKVLNTVGLTDEIAALKDGLDQQLGQGGVSLSGGQRQRMAIARALYGRPELLLLDDLTSALDAENEERLWREMAELIPSATMIVVTHRLATARAMDEIVLIDEGRIVAQGQHHDLYQLSELYREYCAEDSSSQPAPQDEAVSAQC